MSLTPLFSSPCDLAQRIPELIADFLELENKVGRRFREDSLTDIIIASMLQIMGSNATVLTPNETVTGSDFDIMIVEPATGDAVQYRLQAKRLSPHHSQWDWGSYKELAHPHGSGTQASTLVRSSAHEGVPTIPLYAFYNPASAYPGLRRCAVRPRAGRWPTDQRDHQDASQGQAKEAAAKARRPSAGSLLSFVDPALSAWRPAGGSDGYRA